MRRIGILGSAFDPLHSGHLGLAVTALKHGNLDQLWLVPSPARPGKVPGAEVSRRYFWAWSAAKVLKTFGFDVSVRPDEVFGPYRGTYTLLQSWKARHRGDQFCLILGSDSYRTLPQWNDPATGIVNGSLLGEEYPVLVCPREDNQPPLFWKHHQVFSRFKDAELGPYLPCEPSRAEALSSTQIRSELARGTLAPGWSLPLVESDLRGDNPYAKFPSRL